MRGHGESIGGRQVGRFEENARGLVDMSCIQRQAAVKIVLIGFGDGEVSRCSVPALSLAGARLNLMGESP